MSRKDQPIKRFVERDGGVCGLCGVVVNPGEATRDHVIPASLGGARSRHNLRLAHRACNEARADAFPSGEFRGISEETQRIVWRRDRGRCHSCRATTGLLFHRPLGRHAVRPWLVLVLCTTCAAARRKTRNQRKPGKFGAEGQGCNV